MTNILTQIRSRSVSVSVSDEEDIFSSTYKEKETKFEADPLVLAVALKEMIDSTGIHSSLDDPRVLETVTEATREQAERIRKYFSKKFFWNNLTENKELSGFRGRVCYLLENRVRSCKDRDIGIYYKLPYFYEEDMIYDEFKKQYETSADLPYKTWYPVGGNKKMDKERLTLKYLKTTACRQQKRNVNRFWFTDSKYLYSIQIANDNPLLEMFKQLVIDRVEVTFETYYNVDRIDQMHFYKLFNFSLAKETNA